MSVSHRPGIGLADTLAICWLPFGQSLRLAKIAGNSQRENSARSAALAGKLRSKTKQSNADHRQVEHTHWLPTGNTYWLHRLVPNSLNHKLNQTGCWQQPTSINSLEWHSMMTLSYGTLLWSSLALSYGTLLWHSPMVLSYGILLWYPRIPLWHSLTHINRQGVKQARLWAKFTMPFGTTTTCC